MSLCPKYNQSYDGGMVCFEKDGALLYEIGSYTSSFTSRGVICSDCPFCDGGYVQYSYCLENGVY